MRSAIATTFRQLQQDDQIAAAIITGNGRAFCAGLDLASFGRSDRWQDMTLADRTHGIANRPQAAAWVWRTLPMPVVAAVHGVCFGGGLQIASGADIRVAHPDTRMAVMEAKWGLVPDMGGYPLWRGNVRDDVLRELSYTAREFSGAEAVTLGFATHTDADPLTRAMAIAREIAARSPDAVRAAKTLANTTPLMTDAEALMAESLAQMPLMGSPNQIESVRAGMARRPPAFIDP